MTFDSTPAAQVIVMAKAPVAGKVKTRLIPALGPEGAALMAKRLLEHALKQVLRTKAAAALCMEPEPTHADWRGVDPVLIKCFDQTTQVGLDLGERLKNAYRRSAAHHDASVFVGMDCPGLSGDLIARAIEKLVDFEVVITPSTDGGYVLIGVRDYHPELFDGICWSTDQVLTQTLARAQSLGLKVHVFDALADIDEPCDLVHLPAHLAQD